MHDRQRKHEAEGAAGADLGLDADVAAVLAGQLSREVESDSRAANVAGLSILDPLETVEQSREILGGGPNPVVEDLEMRLAIHGRDDDTDLTALRRVLDGVLDQIADDGDHPVGISEDHDLGG